MKTPTVMTKMTTNTNDDAMIPVTFTIQGEGRISPDDVEKLRDLFDTIVSFQCGRNLAITDCHSLPYQPLTLERISKRHRIQP